jgi:selenocysteine-specific elongation factor
MTRPCIIGTAGHIDHGKTMLIKMLTGTDTDRLKDEKKRGISIELGFAALTTPSGVRCGVVDVPGHERFIRNMLAGAGGIDIILLVIAADEGVMPQTREHLDIVDLLGAHTGVVALTKIDMVEADWRELVLEDVHDYLSGTCLSDAPIIPVSSTTGDGKDELLAAIDQVVARADLSPRGRFTRLPIDRVFTLQGFGTVVTGTLWAGILREGDRMQIAPSGKETRIKSLEVHNAHVEEALPGNRVAVNIHGLGRDEVFRGDWLVTHDPPPTTQLLQARFRCMPNSPYKIKSRSRIRFHLGASELIGRVIPLETEDIKPGEEGFVQIRLDKPTLAERGDRYVLRSYSPMRTVGGGVIVDVSGVRRRRFRAEDIEALRLAEEGSLDDRIHGMVTGAGALCLQADELPAKLGQPPEEVKATLDGLVEKGEIRRIGRRLLVSKEAIETAGTRIVTTLTDYQKRNPLEYGLLKSELKSRMVKQVHPDLVEAWIKDRLAAGDLHIREDRLRHGEARIELSQAQNAVRKKMLDHLAATGFAGPSTKALLTEIGNPPDGETLLAHLIREGEIVRVPPDILYNATQLEKMRALMQEFFSKNESMNVGSLKEILGVSRKQGVPLLEWSDRNHWTERRGDLRAEGPRLRDRTG